MEIVRPIITTTVRYNNNEGGSYDTLELVPKGHEQVQKNVLL